MADNPKDKFSHITSDNIVDCGPLDDPVGGSVNLLGGTEIGATARFSCNAGFNRSGPRTLTCAVNGEWSDTPPTCVSLGRFDDDIGEK